jgi:hypothetical protein
MGTSRLSDTEYVEAEMGSQATAVDGVKFGKHIERLMRLMYPRWSDSLRRRPALMAIAFMFLTTIIQLIPAFIFGGITNTRNAIDFTEDAGYPFVQAVYGAAIYYYLVLPSLLAKAFDDLQSNEVFVHSTLRVTRRMRRLFFGKWAYWLPFILTTLATFIIVPFIVYYWNDSLTFWWELHPLTAIVMFSSFWPAWFALAGVIVNVVIAVLIMREVLIENEIVVHPLHPDRSGGFSPLSKFLLQLLNLALVYAIFIVSVVVRSILAGDIAHDFGTFVNAFAYAIVVPILFYVPLRSTHRAMVAFRDDLTRQTSHRYLEENKRIHDTDYDLTAEQLEEKLKILGSLKELERHERAYPVWPFNVRIRLAVLANALVPVVPTVIGLVLDLAK